MVRINASRAFKGNQLLNLYAFKQAKPQERFEAAANHIIDGSIFQDTWSYENFPFPTFSSQKYNLFIAGQDFRDSIDRPDPVLSGGNLQALWLESYNPTSKRFELNWILRNEQGYFPASDIGQALESANQADDSRAIAALFAHDDELHLSPLADVANGYDGQDKLYGNAGNDHLDGGDGFDLLDGGPGADVLIGGRGGDTFVVDNPKDQIIDQDGGSTVEASISWKLGEGLYKLVLTGERTITGEGNQSSNIIEGNDKANKLYGGGGGDVILGGNGDDQIWGIGAKDPSLGQETIDLLTGGMGNDLFVLGMKSGTCYTDGKTTSPGTNDYAIIKDFSRGDRIQLKGLSSDYFISYSAAAPGLDACYFLYRNDSAGPACNPRAWDSNDDLIGQIFATDPSLKPTLSNQSQFLFV